MSDVFIAGIGMTQFGKRPSVSVKQMTDQALREVLADAGIGKDDIQAAFFSNAFQDVVEGQSNIGGQIALRSAGMQGIPIVNVENACASASTAMWLAIHHLRSGAADVVLALGVEKMHFAESEYTERVRRAFFGGMDVYAVEETIEGMRALGSSPLAEAPVGHRTPFMDLYSMMCRAHMKKFGTTQRQLAIIASKNHEHSTHNEKSHFRRPFTVDEVLAGRALGYPLTVPMCSPMTDGAAAAILCTEQGLAKISAKGPRIRVVACELVSGIERKWEDIENSGIARAGRKAYRVAGLGPEDVDVAEVHDATAFGELLVTEALGFCELGQGGAYAESGRSRLGGELPINPSGGLESKGHPIGATGLAQIFELTTQLRGAAGKRQVPGARIALQENGGGWIGVEEGVAMVSILERLSN